MMANVCTAQGCVVEQYDRITKKMTIVAANVNRRIELLRETVNSYCYTATRQITDQIMSSIARTLFVEKPISIPSLNDLEELVADDNYVPHASTFMSTLSRLINFKISTSKTFLYGALYPERVFTQYVIAPATRVVNFGLLNKFVAFTKVNLDAEIELSKSLMEEDKEYVLTTTVTAAIAAVVYLALNAHSFASSIFSWFQ